MLSGNRLPFMGNRSTTEHGYLVDLIAQSAIVRVTVKP